MQSFRGNFHVALPGAHTLDVTVSRNALGRRKPTVTVDGQKWKHLVRGGMVEEREAPPRPPALAYSGGNFAIASDAQKRTTLRTAWAATLQCISCGPRSRQSSRSNPRAR